MIINRRWGLLCALIAAGCGTAFLGEVSETSHTPKAPAEKAPAEKSASSKDEAKSESKAEPKEEAKKEEGKEGATAEGDKEKVEGHVDVRCVPARRLSFLLTANGLGRTEPLPESIGSLTAAVEGHVHRLLVHLGDAVKAGQPILELDPTIAKTALAEKEANRDSLQAALTLLESMPRPDEKRSAELAVDQAKIAVDRARAVVDRLRPLISRQEVSPQQFFDAEQALKQAQVQQGTAEAQLKLLTIGPRPEAVAEAQTKIKMAQQAVANTQALLALHTLRAPIAGVVDSLTCHPGQTLTIGTAVGEVVDMRRVFVTVYFPTRTTRELRVGMPARIDLADGHAAESTSGAKDEIVGHVAFIGSAADPQTGNYAVRILVENDGSRLRFGQVIKTNVLLKKTEPQVAVPEAAIFDQGEGPLLAVVRDGQIKLLHPELGPSEGGNVAITKTDLKEGEPVVIEGAYSVPENTKATILPEPAAAPKAESKTEPEAAAEPGSKVEAGSKTEKTEQKAVPDVHEDAAKSAESATPAQSATPAKPGTSAPSTAAKGRESE